MDLKKEKEYIILIMVIDMKVIIKMIMLKGKVFIIGIENLLKVIDIKVILEMD